MKKTLIVIILFVSGFALHAQREASNWFFGNRAGVKFNADNSITPTTGELSTDEGCSSISDGNGDLLFYTDGITVYDSDGIIMPNGFGLNGSPSSTQSGIIIPKPLDDNIYYIFTVDTATFDDTDFGFSYSEVDMRLNGGRGDVTIKNVNLLQDSSEKISAVLKDCLTETIWVVTLSNATGTPPPGGSPNQFDTFHAFEVTDAGVNPVAVTSPASVIATDQRGYLKFSPDGTKLASANPQNGLYLYEFDLENGVVAGPPTSLFINAPGVGTATRPYGLEFSPSNELLYVSSSNDFFSQIPGENNNPNNHFSSLVQFDITATNVLATQTLIDQRNSYRSALQLGPDRKIYRTQSQTYGIGENGLSVIENPNERGLACDFRYNAVTLTNNARQGLPPFITSFFAETIDIINDPEITSTILPLCEGESYILNTADIPGATYTWFFDEVEQTTPDPPYEFEVFQNGVYEVEIVIDTDNCDILIGQATIIYSDIPEGFTPTRLANSQSTIEVCDDDRNDGVFESFNFTQLDDEILNGQDDTEFVVKYYRTEDDAFNGENEIVFPYTNESNPQQIFVRVENRNNPNCFRVNDTNTGLPISFNIEVFNTPEIVLLENQELCDTEGDTTDGIVTTNLLDFNDGILGPDQDEMDYTISYHDSQDDADDNENPLPNNYENNDPFNEEVFVRIENNAKRDCYTTGRFTLTINLTPIANDASIFQCDEDGVPNGLTIFNVTEVNATVTDDDPNSSVEYYLNTADALAENGAIDASNYPNISNPQVLVARVDSATSDCFSLSEITLEASATSANDAYLGVCDEDGIEDGFTTFILSDADDQVLDGLPAGLGLAYYETLDDALLETNPLPNDYTNEEAFTQTIFVRVENDNNCYGINEVVLEVLGLPNVETDPEPIYYCLNNFPEPITINGGVFDDIPNNYYYDWDTGETTIEIEVNEPRTYTVTVSNVAGCSKERRVIVLPSGTPTSIDFEITDTSENNTITVLANGPGDYEYALEDIDVFYQDSNVFENVRPGIYTVFIRDKNGCGVSTDMVSVVGFPKFFTPNGDGQNDFWQVKGISDQFQANSKILIYDKYGKLMKELNPLGSGWDGTYNGAPVANSDYWFTVTLKDGRQFSSHFALKR